jgi:hypothetical protein
MSSMSAPKPAATEAPAADALDGSNGASHVGPASRVESLAVGPAVARHPGDTKAADVVKCLRDDSTLDPRADPGLSSAEVRAPLPRDAAHAGARRAPRRPPAAGPHRLPHRLAWARRPPSSARRSRSALRTGSSPATASSAPRSPRDAAPALRRQHVRQRGRPGEGPADARSLLLLPGPRHYASARRSARRSRRPRASRGRRRSRRTTWPRSCTSARARRAPTTSTTASTSRACSRSPDVFFCRNNGWAISVPDRAPDRERTFAEKGGRLRRPWRARRRQRHLRGHQGHARRRRRAARGEGPTLIEAITYRLSGHSTSDDPRRTAPTARARALARLDPMARLRRYLEAATAGPTPAIRPSRRGRRRDLRAAIEAAERRRSARRSTRCSTTSSPSSPGTSPSSATSSVKGPRAKGHLSARQLDPPPQLRSRTRNPMPQMNMVQAINDALRFEMRATRASS